MKRRAFTVLEALITALLVGLALAIVGLVTRDFQRVMARSQRRDTALEGLLALHRAGGETAQACGDLVPAINATSAWLSFSRIDPNHPDRIPPTLLPEPVPVPAAWEPRDPAYLVRVGYSVNASRQLIRRVDFPGGDFEQQSCAEEVIDFQARHPRAGYLELRLTVQSGPQVRSLALPVNLQAVPGELAP